MKKKEAQELAYSKSQIIIRHIIELLSLEGKHDCLINFGIDKINNCNTCVAHIYDYATGYEKHLDLEITSDHFMVLLIQLLDDFLIDLLPQGDIKLTSHYMIRSMTEHFTGMDAINSQGSKVRTNLGGSGKEYNDLIEKFYQQYASFLDELKNKEENNPQLR